MVEHAPRVGTETLALEQATAGAVILDDVSVDQPYVGIPPSHLLEQLSGEAVSSLFRIDHEIEHIDRGPQRSRQSDALASERDRRDGPDLLGDNKNFAMRMETAAFPEVVAVVVEPKPLALRTAAGEGTQGGVVAMGISGPW
jgi:hypothetical protein